LNIRNKERNDVKHQENEIHAIGTNLKINIMRLEPHRLPIGCDVCGCRLCAYISMHEPERTKTESINERKRNCVKMKNDCFNMKY
jgi:hypothetical protein